MSTDKLVQLLLDQGLVSVQGSVKYEPGFKLGNHIGLYMLRAISMYMLLASYYLILG